MRATKARVYALITVIIISIITAATFAVVNRESLVSTPALQIASTPIVAAIDIAKNYNVYGGRGFLGLALVAALALGILGFSFKDRPTRMLFLAALCAVSGQLFFVNRDLCSLLGQYLGFIPPNVFISANHDEARLAIPLGVVFYILGLIFFIRATKRERFQLYDFASVDCKRYALWDMLALILVFIVGLVFRTYALNVIADGFEGELSPYSAGASSLQGLLHANRGTNGPWSPLGILYYLPIYLTTKAFGTTIVALRMSSALVGVLTIPLVYLLAARICGRAGGVIAAALFALDCLHIGWSRTDIHPHGVTTWPTLLMCWFLIRAYDTRKIGWACGVALMMGLCWHQYPSGQSAVAAPIIAIALYLVTNRGSLPLSKWQTVVVTSGIFVWVLGLPFSYWLADGQWRFSNPFTLTGPRALWGHEGVLLSKWQTVVLVISTALKQFGDVIQGIFYKQPYLFHQEWIPYADSVNGRTVAWLEVPFFVLGLLLIVRSLKRFESAVILGWMLAAILPGILSEHAYPKRLSTLFPAIDIVAALGVATLLHYGVSQSQSWWRRSIASIALACTFIAYATFTSWSWFSGRYWRIGLPAELAFAERLKEAITPGTVVIGDLNRSYEAGKYLYLTLDHLADPQIRPNLWLPANTPLLPSLIANPLLAPQHVDSTMPYIWTKLRDQLAETKSYSQWQKVLFVIQEGPEDTKENIRNVELASKRCANPKISRIQRERSALNSLVLIECPANEL